MASQFWRSTELKIFLTFLLLFLLFMHWGGWNEESRLALTRSIADDGRFNIDTYANLTGDRSYYGGHYYSEKAPGTSFLATPVSILSGLINDGNQTAGSRETFISVEAYLAKLYFLYELPAAESMLRIFLVAILSALPGALLVVLIYKTSRFFSKEEKYRVAVSFVFGLGTLIFPYSSVLMGSMLATFFAFLGFYLLFKILNGEGHQFNILIPGILIGFSVVIDYLAFFIFIPTLLLLILYRSRPKIVFYFLVGSMIGVFPLMIYNSTIFPSPLEFTLFHVDPSISACANDPSLCRFLAFNQLLNPLLFKESLAGSLFLPYRGLFFYYPVLIFCLLGAYYLWKEQKKLLIYILLIFSLLVTAISLFSYWFGGSSFGLRYGAIMMPFLSIPFTVFLSEKGKSKWIMVIIALLFSISVFHNFLGTSVNWESPSFQIKANETNSFFQWSTGPFEINYEKISYLNPIYNHYMPMFLKDGPRSRLLEGLFTGDWARIDIRDHRPIESREILLGSVKPFGLIVLKIPFLVLPILALLISLIWRQEIFRTLKISDSGLANIVLTITFIVVILFFFLEAKEVVFDKGWYPVHVDGTNLAKERWMGLEANVVLMPPNEGSFNLGITVGSFFKPRTLSIEVNGVAYERNISSFGGLVTITNVSLREGENYLDFRSSSGCDRPIDVLNDSVDYRCLSFVVNDIKFEPAYVNDRIVYADGWYSEDVGHYEATPQSTNLHWAAGNSYITIFSDSAKYVRLSMTMASYHRPRTIKILVGGSLLETFQAEEYDKSILTKTFWLKDGFNRIDFIPEGTCVSPKDVGENSDTRCLSFAMLEASVVSPDDLKTSVTNIIFGSNWYGKNSEGAWMSDNATIALFAEKDKYANLGITVGSFFKSRILKIVINGIPYERSISSFQDSITIINVSLREGENEIYLKSLSGCDRPIDVMNNSGDKRCLSFLFKDVSLNLAFFEDQIIYEKGWYSPDIGYYKDTPQWNYVRWAAGSSTLEVFSGTPKDVRLNLTVASNSQPRQIKIFVDGTPLDILRAEEVDKNLMTKTFKLREGFNMIELVPDGSCCIPKYTTGRNDTRCLSFAMLQASVVNV